MNGSTYGPGKLRVLRAPDFETAPASLAPANGTRSTFTAFVLGCVLPMFAQSVHYMNEVVPFYLISKGWPILVFPLTLYALATMRLPIQALYLVLLAYVVGLTPLLSMIHLGNGLLDALATTVKVWPFTYYFALSALLAWLRPPPDLLGKVLIGWGCATFVIMIALWFTAPTNWYVTDPADGKLLMYELERGYRIYMPMFFGILLIFYCMRRCLDRHEWWMGAAVLIGLALLILIFKQRASIGAIILVIAFAGFRSFPGRLRHLGLAALALLLALAIIAIAGPLAQSISEGLGGSLWLRLQSLQRAITYLGDDPLLWIFGVGATTRFGAVTMADIFGTEQFYLADIGWAGIIFEYGIVGAALIAATYAASFLIANRVASQTGDPLHKALSDYALYLILTSAVYSLVYTPGEIGTITAIVIYLYAAGRVNELPRHGPSQPASHPFRQRLAIITHVPTHPKSPG